MKVQALVIGAGPAGLALAYSLQGDTLLLEKEAVVGGLCRSLHHAGGVFDIGGHSFHTPYWQVRELIQSLLGHELYTQQRDARVYTHGALIPYPFQQFFDHIPDPQVVQVCEQGLRNAAANELEAENVEDYIVRKFGQGIAEHFILPYNRKLWGPELARVSCEWTAERVAAHKEESESFDDNSAARKPLQNHTRVGYPRQEGYAEICKSFAPHLPALELNSAVVQIDPRARVAATEDGRQYAWEFLVSTLPLPVLTRVVEGVPAEIKALAEQLEYISLRVELLLVGKQLETSLQRIYVAAPDVPPHKIALNHNSSDHLRQRPCHAIMAEVSLAPGKKVNVDQITPRTIALLCELNILQSAEDVVWQSHVDVEYAYPVYTPQRPTIVRAIKDWLAQRHIYSLGRFGDWEYINADKCVFKGLALAQELRERYF